MSYFLYYSEKGYYTGNHYCGWGDFECSVCKRDVFIQYDAHEKPSTGELIEWKGKCYCLCNKCISKCMNVGKAKLLTDARSYEPHEPNDEEPEWLKEVPSEYKSVASMLPLVAILGICAIVSKQCHDLPKNKRKDTMKSILAALEIIKSKSK